MADDQNNGRRQDQPRGNQQNSSTPNSVRNTVTSPGSPGSPGNNQQPVQNQPGRSLLRYDEISRIPVLILMGRNGQGHTNPLIRVLRPGIDYPLLKLDRESQVIICPACNARVPTMVVLEPKHPKCLITFLVCTIPCCCCCWPCVCLPYCMDSCQNANHYCPNCNAYVGRYEN